MLATLCLRAIEKEENANPWALKSFSYQAFAYCQLLTQAATY